MMYIHGRRVLPPPGGGDNQPPPALGCKSCGAVVWRCFRWLPPLTYMYIYVVCKRAASDELMRGLVQPASAPGVPAAAGSLTMSFHLVRARVRVE